MLDQAEQAKLSAAPHVLGHAGGSSYNADIPAQGLSIVSKEQIQRIRRLGGRDTADTPPLGSGGVPMSASFFHGYGQLQLEVLKLWQHC